MNPKLSFLPLLIILAGCGGGNSSPAPTPPSATTPPTPPSASTYTAKGTVLLVESSQMKLQPISQKTPSFLIHSLKNNPVLSSTVASSEKPEDFRPYLCYNLLNPGLDEAGKTFETILKDIDVNDDGIADVNISYENGSGKTVYKNISSRSFGWDQIPDQDAIETAGYSSLAEYFEPDNFLFDQYNDLNENIDSDQDGQVDRNITVDFTVEDPDTIQLSPNSLIFYNIESDGETALVNQIVDENSEQYGVISLINHDVNFDGIPDINLDLDGDNIAETQVDTDRDCVSNGDWFVNVGGGTVEGADVTLTEINDTNGDGEYDEISDEEITAVSDENGDFALEGVKKEQSYILKIVKDRGDKKVWIKTNVRVIQINGEDRLSGDPFTLTSAPAIVGFHNSLEENFDALGIVQNYGTRSIVGTHGSPNVSVKEGKEFDFEVGKSWNIKLFAEDINQSDVYRSVPYRDEQGNWLEEKLYFEKPEDTNSGFYEMEYGYELRDDGCFNITLNSYSPLYNDIGNFIPNCDKEIENTYDEVYRWWDYHSINNSDSTGGFNSEEDIRVVINWYNNLYDENAGYDPSLEVKSISINNVIYDWNDLCCVGEFNTRQINFASDDDSLILDITTDVEIQDTDKNLYIRWRPRSNLGKDGSPEFVIGERVSINLEDFSYPRYMYNISGMFCMTETVEENCSSNNYDRYNVDVEYRPNIQEKPADSLNLTANGVPWGEYISENVISVGDTIEFSAQPSDPNNLENEIRWCATGRDCTDWLSESETVVYTFTQDDIGLTFRVDVTLRNNDGVGKEWTNRDGEEEGIFEVDNSFRIQFQVGE